MHYMNCHDTNKDVTGGYSARQIIGRCYSQCAGYKSAAIVFDTGAGHFV